MVVPARLHEDVLATFRPAFDSVIAVRKRRMTWDVNRCPFSTRQTEADIWAALSNPVKFGLGSNDSLVSHQSA